MPRGKILPSKATVVDYVRDGAGLGVTGALSQSMGIVGGVISLWVAPKVAKTTGGKSFNRYFALLMTVDKLLERFIGGPGVI